MEASPLILTLRLNEEAFLFFNARRQQYFPLERNFLSAHLTLFHHLPADQNWLMEDIEEQSLKQMTLKLLIVDVVSIGKGVAYKIDCPVLLQLHRTLQQKWQPHLIQQDKQKLWPHITVQNKVPPDVAKTTLEVLKTSFQSFTAYGIGFDLWRYDGGPWTFIRNFAFMQ